MGEGFEVLIWLGVMGFIALRSAMQRQRKQQQEQKGQSQDGVADIFDRVVERSERASDERVRGPAPRASRAPDDASGRVPARRQPGQPERKSSGLLGRLGDFAAELERQAQAAAAAQEAAQKTEQEESERLVVVPGRQVFPQRRPTDDIEEERAADSHWSDWKTDPDSHGLHEGRGGRPDHTPHGGQSGAVASAPPLGRTDHPRPSGLKRLESYAPLKRAIILAEVLGVPPGLDGVSPAERRLEDMV